MNTVETCRSLTIVAGLLFGIGYPASVAGQEMVSTTVLDAGSPMPQVLFDCRSGVARTDLSAFNTGVIWRSEGCLCGTDAASVKADFYRIVSSLREAREAGASAAEVLSAASFRQEVQLQPGETSTVDLFCYRFEEMEQTLQAD